MLILGIGGTARPDSSSERLLRSTLTKVAALGASTECLAGPDLILPLYAPGDETRSAEATRLVDLMRHADGIIISSPGYHGTVSGLVKNALDYAEDLAREPRPYFDGKPVGCIACAFGWQAPATTLSTLRTVVHALRGWPTPLGLAVNSAQSPATDDEAAPELAAQMGIMARQMFDHIKERRQ